MSDKTPRPGAQHPDEWRADLNPNALAGQNFVMVGRHEHKDAPTAYDLKDIHRQLHDLPDDDLKQIPVVPAGSRLEQGATYIDLARPERWEFTARGGMVAGPEHCYVLKTEVDFELWNRLLGVENPQRTGTRD